MADLLSQRLRNAKKELTALKTAHRRGLGLLKIYKESYTASAPPSSTAVYWITIDINFSLSAYPFVQHYMRTDIGDPSFISTETEIEYKNSGMTIEYRQMIYGLDSEYKFDIISTSPIESMTYDWRSAS